MSNFCISVKTSNRLGAGTNANVDVCLIDKNGKKSQALRLDAFFTNDHERDQLNDYCRSTEKLDEITEIEVWRDGSGVADSWHLEYIAVVDQDTKAKVVFPFYRWVDPSKHHFIEAYDAILPQHAKYLEQRNEEMTKRRELYQYKMNFPGMPVQIKSLPEDDQFSLTYTKDMSVTRISLAIQKVWVGFTREKDASFESIDDVFKVYGYYSNMPIPKDAENWRTDEYFGNQRKNGCNPKLIQLCTEIPENFQVDADVLKPLLEDKTLEDAMKAKRVFLIDLTNNEKVRTKDGAVLTAPYCLLYVKDNNDLVPVAIQLFKTPGPENPVFYPSDDPELWTLVKMWYGLGDANYHQGAVHLGGTHIIMEGFVVSSHRNLSPSHPVYKLLAPHFLFLLPINTRGLGSLLGEGGYVDQTMAVGRFGLADQIINNFGVTDIAKTDLMNHLKNRGVDEEGVLPNFYYRDDAKLVYGIIKNYVTKMIKLFYKTEQDIVNDTELQSWGKEIVAPKPEGQGCVGVPGDGHFTTYDHVIDLCTFIISTCTIEHAAFNFSQYDSYGFPPTYPVRLDGHPPKSKDPVTEKDFLEALCNKEHMMMTLMVGRYLGMRATKSLGDFEVTYHHHPEALKIVEEFREELKKASETITKRDEERSFKYEVLNPAIIPNAISI